MLYDVILLEPSMFFFMLHDCVAVTVTCDNVMICLLYLPSSSFLILTLSFLQDFSFRETNFYFCQFFSNFFKYSFSNFLSSHPNKIFTVYFSSNLLLLNSFVSRFNFTVKIVDGGLYFYFYFFILFYFSFSFFILFSIFRTTWVRVDWSCCHISHNLMA